MEDAITIDTGTGDSEPTEFSYNEPETTEESSEELFESPTQETTTQPVSRDTTIEVDGKQYSVPEKTLKAYYGIPQDEALSDKEYKSMLSSYKLAIHHNNATREVKNQQAEMQKFVEAFNTNPKETLKQMFQSNNKQLQQIAEEIVMEQMEEELLDPREKELRQLRSEKETYAKQLEDERNRIEKEKLDSETENYKNQFNQEIIRILESNPKLAKQESTVKDLLMLKTAALQAGRDISIEQLSSLVTKNYTGVAKALIENSTVDEIIELIGEAKLKEIRKQDINRVKTIGNAPQKTATQTTSRTPSGSITPEEFRKQAQQRLANAMR